MTVENEALTSRNYQTAKDFWKWWQDEPDSDFMISGSPDDGITRMMVERGAHPIEASFISKLALSSVCDEEFGPMSREEADEHWTSL